MRRIHACFLVVLSAAVLAPAASSAQVTAADSAAVLVETAGRFQSEGRPDVARALYRYVTEHFPGTPAALRARALLSRVTDEGTPGGGRVELEVFGTLYGLWLGIAVPGAFGAENPEPYGVGLLVGGPVGFLSGRALAGSRDMTEGQARAITLGGMWGSWQGGGWAEVLDLGETTECVIPDQLPGDPIPPDGYCYESGNTSEETFASMIVGGVAGIATGAVLSRRNITPGVATTVNFGALWGTWFGFAAGYLANQDGDALLASTLLGGDAGLLSMALAAPRWNPSRARARLVSIYGVMGGLGGLGLTLLTRPDDDKVGVGVTLAASALGLAIGIGTTRDADDDRGANAPPDGALLGFKDGSWSFDAPLPYPVLVKRPGPRGMERRAALGLTLLSARF